MYWEVSNWISVSKTFIFSKIVSKGPLYSYILILPSHGHYTLIVLNVLCRQFFLSLMLSDVFIWSHFSQINGIQRSCPGSVTIRSSVK